MARRCPSGHLALSLGSITQVETQPHGTSGGRKYLRYNRFRLTRNFDVIKFLGLLYVLESPRFIPARVARAHTDLRWISV
jgi:hypothetical protein